MNKKPMQEVYWDIATAVDLAGEIEKLSNGEVRGLCGWLAKQGCASGIPALIHGLLLNEAARRFIGADADGNGGGV